MRSAEEVNAAADAFRQHYLAAAEASLYDSDDYCRDDEVSGSKRDVNRKTMPRLDQMARRLSNGTPSTGDAVDDAAGASVSRKTSDILAVATGSSVSLAQQANSASSVAEASGAAPGGGSKLNSISSQAAAAALLAADHQQQQKHQQAPPTPPPPPPLHQASWWTQFIALLVREVRSMTRNPADVAGRMLIFAWVALFIGLLFYGLDPGYFETLR